MVKHVQWDHYYLLLVLRFFIVDFFTQISITQFNFVYPTYIIIGEPNKRYALPNSTIMIHQPIGGVAGQASDIAIHAKEILRVRERLNKIYQKHTKKHSLEAIEKAVERDYFMTAEDALEFGLIDKVLEKR